MDQIRIVDVTDDGSFSLVPLCADPGFDHRSCDYWEDADRGSKAARLSWFDPTARPSPVAPLRPRDPLGEAGPEPVVNAFAPAPAGAPTRNPFLSDDEPLVDNPFASRRPSRPTVGASAPRKLALLGRGLGISGSYAKVLLLDDRPIAYAQFGPLSAYPRALRLRELYPQLPDAPLPAVISCVATTADARGKGHATRLVRSVCDDLAGRGFAAVEAYPEAGARPDATSGATPAFWIAAGFHLAVDDEHFPVLRRELG
jgi:GNAT superfamily N-acetyltransferase